MLTPGKNKRNNRVSILNMKPNSEYTLTTISNEPENDINTNHRVELFLNNEYKGVYFLEYVDEKLKNGDIIVNAHEYGGFEIVEDLGLSLPREDTNITTSAGDIVLYQGNQISLFYNSNSWSYTKLGKILNVSSSELKNILGNGDVTITFTLSR